MKYAIPIADGKLSQHFGRSTEFMIVETDKNGRITSKKDLSTIAHNCGSLPQLLSELEVKVVLAGGMGMGPRMAFENFKINVVLGVSETDPEKAVAAHAKGTLVSGQSSCGHGDTPCGHAGHHEDHQDPAARSRQPPE